MTLEQKQNLIKEHKADTLAALGSYITHVYDISNPFYDKNGELITDYKDEKISLKENEEMTKFISNFRNHIKEFELIEDKIKQDNFNLSLLEINRIAIIFEYMTEIFKKQLTQTQIAIDECKKIHDSLVSVDK